MKLVTRRIISSKPISLKSAAVDLTGFVPVDAQMASSSQAIFAYLKCTTIDELIQFRKDLKPSKWHDSSKKWNAVEVFDDGPYPKASQGRVEDVASGDGHGRRDEKMREMVVVKDDFGNVNDLSRNKRKGGVGKEQTTDDVFDVRRGGGVDSFYVGRKGEKKMMRDQTKSKECASNVGDGDKYEKRVKAEVENGFGDCSDFSRKKK